MTTSISESFANKAQRGACTLVASALVEKGINVGGSRLETAVSPLETLRIDHDMPAMAAFLTGFDTSSLAPDYVQADTAMVLWRPAAFGRLATVMMYQQGGQAEDLPFIPMPDELADPLHVADTASRFHLLSAVQAGIIRNR